MKRKIFSFSKQNTKRKMEEEKVKNKQKEESSPAAVPKSTKKKSSPRVFLTRGSIRYLDGDFVTAAVLSDGTVHTFHGAIDRSNIIDVTPNERLLPDARFTPFRNFFIKDDRYPDEILEMIPDASRDQDSDGELDIGEFDMKRVMSFDIIPKSPLPFEEPDALPEEYMTEGSIDEGNIVKLKIPMGMVMSRMISDDDETPTFEHCIGTKIRARLHVHNSSHDPPKRDSIEIVGTIVDFKFSEFGLPQHIVRIEKEVNSDPDTRCPTLSSEHYPDLHRVYPNSRFTVVDNAFVFSLGPVLSTPDQKLDWREQYLAALKQLPLRRYGRERIKTVKEQSGEFWFAFTDDNKYVTSATRTLKLNTETDNFLYVDQVDAKYMKLKKGDIVFGTPIPKSKKNQAIAWFAAKDHPGLAAFYDFVFQEENRDRDAKQVIDSMKNKGSHTPFSLLISGYFQPKVNYKIVQWFKEKYLWYM